MAAEERFFCSVESRKKDEQIFGTVARIRSWFLLEYPGVWRRDAVKDTRLLSPAVRSCLLGPRWDRALLIRQGHRWDRPEMTAFVVDSSPDSPSMSRHMLTDYEHVPRIDGPGEPAPGQVFAVCTHSRHDACCAKFGNAVWCVLRELAPERAWQCSHLGGDRFAANVVLFPYGIYYGRVRPDDVPELLRTAAEGRIWLPGYRGRSCYVRAVQVAEYFLRQESGCVGFDDFRPLGDPETRGDTTTVLFKARADGRKHRVEYRTIEDAFRERLTCDATDESPVAQRRLLRYTVEP